MPNFFESLARLFRRKPPQEDPAPAPAPQIAPAPQVNLSARVDQAMEGILGNEALTADLDDGGARALLEWARQRVEAVVQVTAQLDDTSARQSLYPHLQALRAVMRAVNAAVPAWSGMNAGDRRAALANLVAQAAVLYGTGFKLPSEGSLHAFTTQPAQAGKSHADWVMELIALIEPQVNP